MTHMTTPLRNFEIELSELSDSSLEFFINSSNTFDQFSNIRNLLIEEHQYRINIALERI
jgi:hypothetical protein